MRVSAYCYTFDEVWSLNILNELYGTPCECEKYPPIWGPPENKRSVICRRCEEIELWKDSNPELLMRIET